MSSFSDSVFDKIYLLAVEWGCLLLDIQTLEIVRKANRLANDLCTRDPHRIAQELGIEVIPLLNGVFVPLRLNCLYFFENKKCNHSHFATTEMISQSFCSSTLCASSFRKIHSHRSMAMYLTGSFPNRSGNICSQHPLPSKKLTGSH